MKETEIRRDWPKVRDEIPELPKLFYLEKRADWEALWCRPVIDETAWVSPGAAILGRVRLKAHSSVWYGCVLRGDQEFIEVGEETNIQDGSILHIEPGRPCILGSRVTLGHHVTVHASMSDK